MEALLMTIRCVLISGSRGSSSRHPPTRWAKRGPAKQFHSITILNFSDRLTNDMKYKPAKIVKLAIVDMTSSESLSFGSA